MNLSGDGLDDARFLAASAAALGNVLRIDPSIAGSLMGCRRTTARLARLVAQRLGPLPDTVTLAQHRLLHMQAASLQVFSRRVGAVRHARAVVRMIDGAALRTLADVLGKDAREAAFRWHALTAEAPDASDGRPLHDMITDDGVRCLHSWCDGQQSAIGERVRLALPASTSFNGAEAELSSHIVDVLAAEDA